MSTTSMTFKVPSIKCEGCGDTITKEIKVTDPDAKVDVDIKKKTVSVESNASESSIRQSIVAVGHEVA